MSTTSFVEPEPGTREPEPRNPGTSEPRNLRALYSQFINHNRRRRLVAPIDGDIADRLDDVEAFGDDAEDRVAAIEMRRWRERDEELAAVGVRAGVGHREDAG